MIPTHSRTEQPMTFLTAMPPAVRTLCWIPKTIVTLTLPGPDGHTAFTVHRCPQTHQLAHNVARYPCVEAAV